MAAADDIIENLAKHGFALVDQASDELPLDPYNLVFERRHSPIEFEYVIITFASDGELGFGASYGVREYARPHKWKYSANLARRRIGIRKSCNLGAEWFTPFKRRKFWRDWRFLQENVEAIVHFLETGKPNRHMVDVTS